jgi:hypothetical protein
LNQENGRYVEQSYEKVARDSPTPRNRGKGKENWDLNVSSHKLFSYTLVMTTK